MNYIGLNIILVLDVALSLPFLLLDRVMLYVCAIRME